MVFETDFFFLENARWNLGWPTPNYAGAFLATLVCLLWAANEATKRFSILAPIAETFCYILLAKTYSRGSILALVAGALYYIVALRGITQVNAIRIWGIRFVTLALLLFATGNFQRMSLDYVVADRSVSNRVQLWKGATAMVAQAPVTGWGAGESGRSYMDWFQDVDKHDTYATLVNSYLTLAVEHGLLMFSFALTAFLFPLILGLTNCRYPVPRWLAILTASFGGSLSAWMVANVFTTLYFEWRLWCLPAAATGVLLGRCFYGRLSNAAMALFLAMSLAALASGGLYCFGSSTLEIAQEQVAPSSERRVVAETHGTGEGGVKLWHTWLDTKVMGPHPGKEIRRWLRGQKTSTRMIVHPNSATPKHHIEKAYGVMIVGRHSAIMSGMLALDCQHLLVIHPMTRPPTQTDFPNVGTITLCLPSLDQTGNSSAWRRWAASSGAHINEPPDVVGTDIRLIWPEAAMVDAR